MLEDSCHLPGCGWNTCDCHDRVTIDFENLVRAIVNNRVTGGRSSIACDEHTVSEFERENRRRFRRFKVFPQFSWSYRSAGGKQTMTPQQCPKIFHAAPAEFQRLRAGLTYSQVGCRCSL